MRHVGEQALTFRLPAIDGTGLTVIEPDELLGRWVVLSFVSGLEQSDTVLWDEQGRNMQAFGGALLIVPLEAKTLHGAQFYPPVSEHFTIVADPLGRLERLYGARTFLSPGRARTFLIGPDGRLRFHALHSLSERGMGVVMELLQTYQTEEIPA